MTENEQDELMQTKYLDRKADGEDQPKKYNQANRCAKFEATDGRQKVTGMEFEQCSMIHSFEEGLILTLLPPLEFSQGLLLLKKQNC